MFVNQKITFVFVVGIIFAIIAALTMIFGGSDFLPLSITTLIIGIILISSSPVLAKRVNISH